nr:immunoglobulin light chain junction region [Macaca mulatta]MOX78184.1 immunoglobulin light chain junction region [Macaca mulatta]MOX78514.1 immunoglobulin light chain junction region [Macaca mulatta]MOX79208.1 immunoglobulin light chain junction region [Macaca mulatta]MOX79729.1 immunoglobulin light chain junction region [Macaca mulatta]
DYYCASWDNSLSRPLF